MVVTADDREKPSGIIDALIEAGMDVVVRRLSWCDYVINGEICIERKTGMDFLVSIIDGRLFRQASAMKKRLSRAIFLVEGNPFHVDMDIKPESVRGAILSLQVIWYIPIIFSTSKENTCEIFKMIGIQQKRQNHLLTLRHGYRPKKLITRQLYILQGLPGIGPFLAKRLLQHFGSVGNVMQADLEALSEIEGIGKGKAGKIRSILDKSYRESGNAHIFTPET